jgi:hypothetical protein
MAQGLSAGTLEKMNITSFARDRMAPQDLLGTFFVMFNPNQYTRRYANRLTTTQEAGSHGNESRNVGSEPQEMNFEFLLDATGVAAPAIVVSVPRSPGAAARLGGSAARGGLVELQVQQFLGMTYSPNPEQHVPPCLVLNWGALSFICKLKSVDVEYTLFDPAGRPLRAKLKTTFIQHDPPSLISRILNFRSPDLTRYHVVETGDTLHNLAHKVYEDPAYHVALARFNKLNTFRRLKTGSTLRLPPLQSGNT